MSRKLDTTQRASYTGSENRTPPLEHTDTTQGTGGTIQGVGDTIRRMVDTCRIGDTAQQTSYGIGDKTLDIGDTTEGLETPIVLGMQPMVLVT